MNGRGDMGDPSFPRNSHSFPLLPLPPDSLWFFIFKCFNGVLYFFFLLREYLLISDVQGVAVEKPLVPSAVGEPGRTVWVGQSPPFRVQGQGQENLYRGWWAGEGIPACQIFKLFLIHIYKRHGPALVNKGSFGDTQWWSSLRGLSLVDMPALRL